MQSQITPEPEIQKVSFRLGKNHWSGYLGESMWATQLSSGIYRLENLPLYVDNISFEDTFIAKKVDGIMCFEKVLSRSGNSTYRFFRSKGIHQDIFAKYLNLFSKHGCGSICCGSVYSVNIPKDANLIQIHKLFEVGGDSGIWEFEVAHCGHFS